MPTGWYGLICAICFGGLTPEECYVDEHGDRWDLHPGVCASAAGLTDRPAPPGPTTPRRTPSRRR